MPELRARALAGRLLYPGAMYRWLALFAVGCGLSTGSDPPPATSFVEVHDRPVAHWRHQVDLVFVIDTTPTMTPLRDRVVANMVRFADSIERYGGTDDLMIFAITSDPADGGHLLGAPLHLVSRPAGGFRHEFEGALADRLAALVPASFTAASSQPLEELAFALQQDVGFRRGDTGLAFVPITNRDDESPGAVADYVPRILALSGTEYAIRYAPIYAPPAARLEQVNEVNQDGAALIDIATEDWSEAMLAIGAKSTLPLYCLDAPPIDRRDCTFAATYQGIETALPLCDDTISNRPCEELRETSWCEGSGIETAEQFLEWPAFGTQVHIECATVTETSTN